MVFSYVRTGTTQRPLLEMATSKRAHFYESLCFEVPILNRFGRFYINCDLCKRENLNVPERDIL